MRREGPSWTPRLPPLPELQPLPPAVEQAIRAELPDASAKALEAFLASCAEAVAIYQFEASMRQAKPKATQTRLAAKRMANHASALGADLDAIFQPLNVPLRKSLYAYLEDGLRARGWSDERLASFRHELNDIEEACKEVPGRIAREPRARHYGKTPKNPGPRGAAAQHLAKGYRAAFGEQPTKWVDEHTDRMSPFLSVLGILLLHIDGQRRAPETIRSIARNAGCFRAPDAGGKSGK